MNPNPQASADASADSYSNRPLSDIDNQKKPVPLNGHEYTVFGYKNDPISGFHATAYRNAPNLSNLPQKALAFSARSG